MKFKTGFGVVLVLILSFFSVSFRMGDFLGKAATPTLAQSAKLTPTPQPDDSSGGDTPSKQGIKFEKQLLNDTFDNNDNGWQVGNEKSLYWKGTRQIKDGTLTWDGASVNSMLDTYDYPDKANLPEEAVNIEVSAKVKLIDPKLNGSIGLMLRSNETDAWHDFYFFGLNTTGKSFSFLRSSNENYEYLIWEQEIPDVKLKDWNDLSVQVVGSHFSLYLNGDLVGEVDDANIATGDNGTMVSWNESNEPIKVQFDDFVVKEAENVPAEMLVKVPTATPEAETAAEPTAPAKEKATKGPHTWSLPLYPEAEFLVSELDGDAATDANVEKQARNLAIEPPYSYEFYYLPTVRSFDEVRAFYKKEVLKLGYSPAADLQGNNGIYLLTFVNKSSSPQKKITIQYWTSVSNVMIIYKNP